MALYELTDEHIDIIEHAVRAVHFFDGFHPDYHPARSECDCDRASDALVALGCNDPREMEEDDLDGP